MTIYDYEYYKKLPTQQQKVQYLKSKGVNSQNELNALRLKVKEEYEDTVKEI